MEVVFIGKDMCRIIVRSKAIREKLSKIPGIKIEGNRVVFPSWLLKSIEKIINPISKKKEVQAKQIDLF
jgi:hypothetical protein